MDESSPVYENFMNKMSAMGSGRPKINRTTFNIGANVLEKRVASNSRKITIIKSILKNQKIDVGEKLTTPEPDKTTEVSKELASINSTLVSIGNILSTDFANRIAIEEGQNKLLKSEKQRRRRAAAESGIEGVKKVVGKGLGKLTSPIQKTGSNVLEALSLLGLGAAGNIAFNLLKDFDSERFTKILNGIKKNYKWIIGTVAVLGGVLALGTIINAIQIIKGALAIMASKPFLILTLSILGTMAIDKFARRGPSMVDTLNKESEERAKKSGIPVSEEEKAFNKKAGERYDILKTKPILLPQGGNLADSMLVNDAISNEIGKLFKRTKTIELPPIVQKLYKSRKLSTDGDPPMSDVPYLSSINTENEYMEKTPEIHGIKL